jgi:5-oxoprolinase (ATP-hydrolysing)
LRAIGRIIVGKRASTINGLVFVQTLNCGGTHLPDITVITPVFDESGREMRFYVASRGHHADIGGMPPGSMPPDSVTIDQEGILLDHFLLVGGGRFRERELLERLAAGPWPARNPR